MTIGPGTLVNGKYRLGRQLGEGGMGAIFEARHEFLGTEVALKFLHPALSSRPNVVARFVQEARVSANMKSPHIVSVVDVDQSPEGLAFLVMELLRGEALAGRLAREPVLPLPLTLNIAVQVLLALEVAHALGVVHRDMKPENVFLTDAPGQAGATSDGLLVKILDFGIAKLRTLGEVKAQLTKPGMVMGTPEYMAPEQVFSADAVDARADIYALGAMIFEMLAGRRPVQGDDARAIAAVVMSGNTPRLDAVAPRVPKEIADVVAISLAPKPNDRFSSAAAMLRALVNAAKEANVTIEAPSSSMLAKKSLVPGKTGLGASVGLGGVGLGVAPQAMFGPGDPAAMAAFDARARGELPAGLAASGAAQAIPDTRPSKVAPEPEKPRDGRIETGTVAHVPEPQPPPQHSDSTAFGAPSPYAPPYGDGSSTVVVRDGGSGNATQSGGSTAPSNAYGTTSQGTPGPGGTDAGMLSPYAKEGAWTPASGPSSSTVTPVHSYPQRSQGGRGTPWLPIAIIVLSLAAVAGGAIYYFTGTSDAPPPPPPPSAVAADDQTDDEPTPKKNNTKPPAETTETAPVATEAPKPPPPKPKPSASAKPPASTSASTSAKPPPSASTSKPPDIIEIPLPLPFP